MNDFESAVTTAYMREILTHHYMGPDPFPRPTDLYWGYVKTFVALGLLRMEGDAVKGNDEPLRVYMGALGAVPLPVQRWVMPPTEPTDRGCV